MKISIGNDHAGTDYKFAIIKLLKTKGIEVTNYGTDANDSVDSVSTQVVSALKRVRSACRACDEAKSSAGDANSRCDFCTPLKLTGIKTVAFNLRINYHSIDAYSTVYGIHPREFEFSKDGTMIPYHARFKIVPTTWQRTLDPF